MYTSEMPLCRQVWSPIGAICALPTTLTTLFHEWGQRSGKELSVLLDHLRSDCTSGFNGSLKQLLNLHFNVFRFSCFVLSHRLLYSQAGPAQSRPGTKPTLTVYWLLIAVYFSCLRFKCEQFLKLTGSMSLGSFVSQIISSLCCETCWWVYQSQLIEMKLINFEKRASFTHTKFPEKRDLFAHLTLILPSADCLLIFHTLDLNCFRYCMCYKFECCVGL